ncbi:MAG TPA: M24 family metallopeptidase [Bacteroidia bacterium]|jgi:Xaa-Pro aminopeptidase|nr:M24 family metallopeptidase [Bacteroidia bacterium]
MNQILNKLIEAEEKAVNLFTTIKSSGLIVSGKSEKTLSKEIHQLAKNLYGVRKYWHKRIVRAGENTLYPYKENPPDLIIQPDDILFFDFGPIFEDFEADIGRTYVLGNNPLKLKLMDDVENAWKKARDWYIKQDSVTGAELYDYCKTIALEMGWKLNPSIAGHIIGKFPHEKLKIWQKDNYIHPGNKVNMRAFDKSQNERHWILEIHLIDEEKKIGGFFEQLLI